MKKLNGTTAYFTRTQIFHIHMHIYGTVDRLCILPRAPSACAVYNKSGKFANVCGLFGAREERLYMVDIRWRVVYQRIGMGLHFSIIAKQLNIATSTAHRIYHQFEHSGDVEPVHHGFRHELRTLDEQNELLVIGLIMESPSLYLEELCKEVQFLTITISYGRYCITSNNLQHPEAIWHVKKTSAPSCDAQKWCISWNIHGALLYFPGTNLYGWMRRGLMQEITLGDIVMH